jgi:uncharacterized protein YciI
MFATASTRPADPKHTRPADPKEEERPMSLFAVHRTAGPGWLEGKGAFDQPGVTDHTAYMDSPADAGVIVAAGPLADTAGDRIRVLLIAEADNATDVAQRLAADPWERADRITTHQPQALNDGSDGA